MDQTGSSCWVVDLEADFAGAHRMDFPFVVVPEAGVLQRWVVGDGLETVAGEPVDAAAAVEEPAQWEVVQRNVVVAAEHDIVVFELVVVAVVDGSILALVGVFEVLGRKLVDH